MRYGKETNEWVLRKISCVVMGLFAFLFAGVFSQAEATRKQPVCGDTITTNVTLKYNLDCSKIGGTALTVVGPARLNLNGFEVIGNGNDGIYIDGKRAVIVNGKVRNCVNGNGVYAGGDGYHQIVNLMIENNNRGVFLGSNNNRVINNAIKNNETRGIRVNGSYNHILYNFIENSSKGIRVENDVERNRIVGNILIGNNAENCQVKGDRNWIINNLAYTGEEEGFLIEGNDNWIKNNTALNCGTGNPEGGGFVGAEGASGNYFFNNTALDNFPNDLIDYTYDENCVANNENCIENKWFNNKAESGYPEFITTFPGTFRYSIFGK
jgi:hypothetical protein